MLATARLPVTRGWGFHADAVAKGVGAGAVRRLLARCLEMGALPRELPRLYSSVHYAEPRLHYEVSRPSGRKKGLELGFHCKARDKDLNRYLLLGFRRNLFEIKTELGDSVEAEMWDRGWTKIYEVLPEVELSAEFQVEVGGRLAQFIICLHPIHVQLGNDVAQIHR